MDGLTIALVLFVCLVVFLVCVAVLFSDSPNGSIFDVFMKALRLFF